MKRKELLHKRTKLSQEINDLIKTRGKSKDDTKLNKKIEEKKKLYQFYCNMLKKYIGG